MNVHVRSFNPLSRLHLSFFFFIKMSWAGSMDLKHCLLDLKSSTIVSSSKVQHAAKVSLDYAHEYKFVVHAIENFIWKNTVEFRFAGFCVLDSIVRQSHGKNKEKDVFAPRFSKRMKQTLCAMKETSVRDQVCIECILVLLGV